MREKKHIKRAQIQTSPLKKKEKKEKTKRSKLNNSIGRDRDVVISL